VPKTQLGKDVIELMKAGVITENSVGILPIQKEDKGDYRELKEVFLMGTPDEAARQYAISVYGIATEYYRNDVDKNGEHTKYRGPNGYSKAIKEAVKQVKASITRMNPNILSPVKKKPVETAKWVKWLNKDEKRGKVYMYELRKLEGQYFTKVDEMEKLIHKYLRDPEAVKLIKKALK